MNPDTKNRLYIAIGVVSTVIACGLLVVLLAILTDDEPSTPSTAAPAASSESPDVEETPEPPNEPAAMGETQQVTFGEITVLDFDPKVEGDPELVDIWGGGPWSAVLARTCTAADWNGQPITVSWLPWRLQDVDDGRYSMVDITGGVSFPQPTYPNMGATVEPGSCVKGWIVFAAPKGTKLDRVVYEGTLEPEPKTWMLRK